MGAIANWTGTLAANVASPAGTVVVPAYPTGTVQADLLGSVGGVVSILNVGTYAQADSEVTFTFGASTITITNTSGVTWPAGATIVASFGRVDRKGSYNLVLGTAHDTAKRGDAA